MSVLCRIGVHRWKTLVRVWKPRPLSRSTLEICGSHRVGFMYLLEHQVALRGSTLFREVGHICTRCRKRKNR